ncbi:MAG: hypothetical protein ACRKFN_10780 [Desulfitobacterium sp.]
MKRKLMIVFILILSVGLCLFFLTGGKMTNVAPTDFSLSEDGKVMNIEVGVTSSMGYVRKMNVKQGGDNLYLTFYSTFGLNSNFGAKNKFRIELTPICEEIYFYHGDGGFSLVLQKDSQTNKWVR